MTKLNKEKIQAAVIDKIAVTGSQNKAAGALGISPAHLINIRDGKFDLVSEKMLNELQNKLNLTRNGWQISIKTTAFKRVTRICEDSQLKGRRQIIIGRWGAGKSETLKNFHNSNKEVFYIECEEYWTMKEFLKNMMVQLSIADYNYTAVMMTNKIISQLNKRQNPLLIIDEAGELTDRAFKIIKALSNKTNAGILVAGTHALKNKIDRKVEQNKETFGEFFDRFGGRYLTIETPSKADIKETCAMNGITDSIGQMHILKYATGLSYRALKTVINTYLTQLKNN
jgi:AAA domain-containing protein